MAESALTRSARAARMPSFAVINPAIAKPVINLREAGTERKAPSTGLGAKSGLKGREGGNSEPGEEIVGRSQERGTAPVLGDYPSFVRSTLGSQRVPARSASARAVASPFLSLESGAAAAGDTASLTAATIRALGTCFR